MDQLVNIMAKRIVSLCRVALAVPMFDDTFAISYLPQIQVNNGHKVMYKLRSMWNYADRHIVIDVLRLRLFDLLSLKLKL